MNYDEIIDYPPDEHTHDVVGCYECGDEHCCHRG